MSDLFFQVQKAIEVCSSLDRYRLVRFSPLKINCRCPVCGDSEKSSIKARFWINEKDGSLLVGCFNCNYHSNFISFCKDYYPETFKELMFNKYNNDTDKKVEELKKRELDKELEKINQKKNSLAFLVSETLETSGKSKIQLAIEKFSTPVKSLPKEHPIVAYMIQRKIPLKYWNYFYFTQHWQELVNTINPESYKNFRSENRLLMVIKDFDSRITAVQGRSLEKDSRNKYITIKESDHSNKIFGLDKVDLSKTVFMTEGIVDSLFIENAIAITGGSLDFDSLPVSKDNRVWVWDNEPFAPHTVQRIQKAVDAGENIVLFDKVSWTSKDINDLITKENISSKEVNEYLNQNIINGLQAQLRFKNWRKVQ